MNMQKLEGQMAKLTMRQGDNFEFAKNESIDFVLTDPPFNISKKSNFHTYEKNTIHSYQFDDESEQSWDSYTHEEFIQKLDDWASEWSRVLRKGGNFAIFCADIYVSHLMEALTKNNLSPRRLIVWRKNNAVPVNRAYMPMSANEYIIVCVKKGKNTVFNANVPIVEQTLDNKIIEATIVADKVSTIVYTKIKEAILAEPLKTLTSDEHISFIENLVSETIEASKTDAVKKVNAMYKDKDNEEEGKYLQACVPNYIQNPLKVGNRIHPTEKPIQLLQYLVALYSNPGDTLLDSFGGSGASVEAALSLGRNAILVEREPSFYEKSKKRLAVKFSNIEEV